MAIHHWQGSRNPAFNLFIIGRFAWQHHFLPRTTVQCLLYVYLLDIDIYVLFISRMLFYWWKLKQRDGGKDDDPEKTPCDK